MSAVMIFSSFFLYNNFRETAHKIYQQSFGTERTKTEKMNNNIFFHLVEEKFVYFITSETQSLRTWLFFFWQALLIFTTGTPIISILISNILSAENKKKEVIFMMWNNIFHHFNFCLIFLFLLCVCVSCKQCSSISWIQKLLRTKKNEKIKKKVVETAEKKSSSA